MRPQMETSSAQENPAPHQEAKEPPTAPCEALALVDYDNVRTIRRESSALDYQTNLETIVDRIADALPPDTRIDRVSIRLYGGWIDAFNRVTPHGESLRRNLGAARSRRRGTSFSAEIAYSPAALSGEVLRGTLRRKPCEGFFYQKMVDSMLCLDAVHFAEYMPTIVASDDDDVFIGALVASKRGVYPVSLLRSRATGKGLNDHLAGTYRLKLVNAFGDSA
jgi:hypothetical protein